MEGNWTNRDNIMNQDLSWKRLVYGMSDNLLKFLLRSKTNTMATKDYLRRLGAENISVSCTLCGGQTTARHVLSGCVISLKQGQYTWRHNNCLLKAIKDHVLSDQNKFWVLIKPGHDRRKEKIITSTSSRTIT